MVPNDFFTTGFESRQPFLGSLLPAFGCMLKPVPNNESETCTTHDIDVSTSAKNCYQRAIRMCHGTHAFSGKNQGWWNRKGSQFTDVPNFPRRTACPSGVKLVILMLAQHLCCQACGSAPSSPYLGAVMWCMGPMLWNEHIVHCEKHCWGWDPCCGLGPLLALSSQLSATDLIVKNIGNDIIRMAKNILEPNSLKVSTASRGMASQMG